MEVRLTSPTDVAIYLTLHASRPNTVDEHSIMTKAAGSSVSSELGIKNLFVEIVISA